MSFAGRRTQVLLFTVIAYSFLIIAAIGIIWPYLWMVCSSLQEAGELWNKTIWDMFPKHPNLKAYISVGRLQGYPLQSYLLSSLIITVGSTFLTIIVCLFAAYVLARKNLGIVSKILIAFFFSVMFLPEQLKIIPIYKIVNELHLLNTYLGVILPMSVNGMIFIILYRFFKAIPDEIEDAAKIDGAGELALLFKIILPLAKGAIHGAIVLAFLGGWNAFILPLVLTTDPRFYNLQVALSTLESAYWIDFQGIMALTTLITIPAIVVYALAHAKVVGGLMAGAIKG